MTTDTKREAVAKSIFEVLAAFEDSWDSVMQWRRESFLRAADAAIEAMKGLTPRAVAEAEIN